MDNGLLLHRGVVATTVGIDDRAAHDFKVGAVDLRPPETIYTCLGLQLSNRRQMVFVTPVVDVMQHRINSRNRSLHIVVVAITSCKELADIHLLRTFGRLHVTGSLAVCDMFRISKSSNGI